MLDHDTLGRFNGFGRRQDDDLRLPRIGHGEFLSLFGHASSMAQR